ncbi:hypothetical protein [Oerskovia flava]|uniref:hypothetical protein n=1 Tax=Oerskovia flava TaxID=2986422 RepID=UPI00223EC01B|nr:hypothetical protein [Oerskovia sp. JB1-3-2]
MRSSGEVVDALAEALRVYTARSVSVEAVRRDVAVLSVGDEEDVATLVVGLMSTQGLVENSGMSLTTSGYADRVKGETMASRLAYIEAWVRAEGSGDAAPSRSADSVPNIPEAVSVFVTGNSAYGLDRRGQVTSGGRDTGLRLRVDSGSVIVVDGPRAFRVRGEGDEEFASSLLGILDSRSPGADD